MHSKTYPPNFPPHSIPYDMDADEREVRRIKEELTYALPVDVQQRNIILALLELTADLTRQFLADGEWHA